MKDYLAIVQNFFTKIILEGELSTLSVTISVTILEKFSKSDQGYKWACVCDVAGSNAEVVDIQLTCYCVFPL